MLYWVGKSLRHPLFPGLRATSASEAKTRQYDALAGSFHELQAAAIAGATARRAVFVTAPEGWNLPTDSQRDVLWILFQVPSYVLQLDSNGKVRAYECEARSGLHNVRSGENSMECACGRPGLAASPFPCGRADHDFAASASSAA